VSTNLGAYHGLLGANAHILRALSIEIKRLSFTSDLKIRYWLRLFLGMLAGIAIGWVSIPSDQILDGNLNTESLGIQSSISLPLAFLAGYSVELLFAAMDRIISAFSSQNQTKPK
jgi:TRAP-type C4-dicarboxylate transport system permease small subunit